MWVLELAGAMFVFGLQAFAMGGYMLIAYVVAVRRGLCCHPGRPPRLKLVGDQLAITRSKRRRSVALREIARARHAHPDGWTRSLTTLEAITLFDARGCRLAKIPVTATGWATLLADLRARGVPIEEVWVETPSYMD
jgi:hypothetical protein